MDLGRRGDAFPRYPIHETGLRSDPEGQKLPCRRDAHRNPIRHAHNPNNFFNDIVKTNAELSLEPLPLDAFDMGVNATLLRGVVGAPRTRCCGRGWGASYADGLTTVVVYPSDYGTGEPTGASVAGCVALAGEMERCCEGNYEGFGRYACGGGDRPVG